MFDKHVGTNKVFATVWRKIDYFFLSANIQIGTSQERHKVEIFLDDTGSISVSDLTSSGHFFKF